MRKAIALGKVMVVSAYRPTASFALRLMFTIFFAASCGGGSDEQASEEGTGEATVDQAPLRYESEEYGIRSPRARMMLYSPPSSADDSVRSPNSEDIFQDDFSDPSSGWPREPEGDEYGSIRDYADGGYRIYNTRSGKLRLASAPAGERRDTIVEVDASRVGDAPSGPSAIGIICRRTSSTNNYYRMGFRVDGSPVIGKHKDGEFTALAGDFPSDAFLEGEATNHIRGDCVGDTLTLYVNDQKVLEAQDAEFGSGEVGLFVGNRGDEPSAHDVWFDNFSASDPGVAAGDAVQPPNPGDIFQDDFSDTSSGWTRRPEGDEYGSIRDYADGGYRIYNARPRTTLRETAPAVAGRDVIVEVDASRVGDAPSGPSAAGIICRRTSNNYYTMGVRSDSSSVIGKYKDGEFTALEREFSSDAILEGEAINHIRGDCVGNTLTLYVNDQKVLEAEDAEFESGEVGLFVVNNGDEPSVHDVSFDNFSVSSPGGIESSLQEVPKDDQVPGKVPPAQKQKPALGVTLRGSTGNDTLQGTDNPDTMEGSTGSDWLYGYSGDDRLDGSTGADHLFGGEGQDAISGSSGDDFIDDGNDGVKDTIECSAGFDTAVVGAQDEVKGCEVVTTR